MIGLDKLVRNNVRSLTPYLCARDEYQGKGKVFLDANENPYGSFNRYPDPYQKELKSVISKIKNVSEEEIFLGNGSDEIIDLCFRVFCDPGTDRALTFSPTYGMYGVSAAVNDIQMISVPLNERFGIDYDNIIPLLSDKRLKLILICSPNNPTGNCQDIATLEKIISGFEGIVLLDEAYIDFAGKPSFKDRIDAHQNLIVMQTFSKAFGMASLRVGMAFANPGILHYFNKMKPPYNISTINQKTVIKKLSDISSYNEEVRKIIEERVRLSSQLIKLPAVDKVYSSDANFVLVRFRDAVKVYNYLADNRIIVRNRSSVVNNCLRITIGKKSENNMLLKALKSFQI